MNPALDLMKGLINIHPSNLCRGTFCVFHNPSGHHMTGWPAHWEPVLKVVLRVCAHGVYHPDPDLPSEFYDHKAHLKICDGCCQPNYLTEDDFFKELFSD